MNIFILHNNPIVSASLMVKKHIVKMPLESAQMICTAVRLYYGTPTESKSPYSDKTYSHNLVKDEYIEWEQDDNGRDKPVIRNQYIYKSLGAAHFNHPSTKWIRESAQNFKWVVNHAYALQHYWRRHFNRHPDHNMSSIDTIDRAISLIDSFNKFPEQDFTPVRIAISDKNLHRPTVYRSYRVYYVATKTHLGWRPDYWTEDMIQDAIVDCYHPSAIDYLKNHNKNDKLPRGKLQKISNKVAKLMSGFNDQLPDIEVKLPYPLRELE